MPGAKLDDSEEEIGEEDEENNDYSLGGDNDVIPEDEFWNCKNKWKQFKDFTQLYCTIAILTEIVANFKFTPDLSIVKNFKRF